MIAFFQLDMLTVSSAPVEQNFHSFLNEKKKDDSSTSQQMSGQEGRHSYMGR
jgi:hypothetical protein